METKIEVTCCNDCPFLTMDQWYFCSIEFKDFNKEESIKEAPPQIIPEWCPLRSSPRMVALKLPL